MTTPTSSRAQRGAESDSADQGAWLDELSTGHLEDSPPGVWVQDYLPGCSRMTLPLGEDFEGPVSATLVRLDREPSGRSDEHLGAPVLQIHGWSDYFYNLPTARSWADGGHRFYALDLRKYGRSLRSHQTPGHIESLQQYDTEIAAALAVIAEENPQTPAPIISGHSTGGLVAALWAERNPHRIGALVLNSPWLELPGDALARAAAEGIVTPWGAVNPTATLRVPRLESYWESLSDEAQGQWRLHPLWRPRKSFRMTLGWLKAVFAGHRRIYEGLDMDVPVLVLLSTATVFRAQWTPEHQQKDSVLDVELLARRAVRLGRHVTVVRLPGAMHDVFASGEQVRLTAYAETARWLQGYAPQRPPPRSS
ncbi:MAG: alpha/beta hydrolase [Nesterenkonia sp.]